MDLNKKLAKLEQDLIQIEANTNATKGAIIVLKEIIQEEQVEKNTPNKKKSRKE